MYGIARASIERALGHRHRPDAVRDVDDLRVGGDPLHHAAADAGVVVLDAEVGEEGDVLVHGHVLPAPAPSRRGVDRVEQALEVVTARPRPRPSSPTERATRVVSGPMLTAGASPPIHAYAFAAEPEASTTRSPSGGSGWSSCVA